MKKLSIVSILILLIIGSAKAQDNRISIQYSAGLPLSGLKDYIGEPSYRGVSITYHSMLTPNVGLGLDAAWNVFYEEKGFNTIVDGTESLSGYEYRYSNNVPLLASGAYYFMPEKAINPFASLGIGAVYAKRDTDLGSIRFSDDAWHFAVKPEIGIIYQFSDGLGAKLSSSFYQMFENDDFGDQSFVSINLGLIFRKF